MEDYKTPKEASKMLGVHWQTLKNWDRDGLIDTIRTPGGKRLYNVSKYLNNNNKDIALNLKKNICYCRVSTIGQKSDLENQINFMKEKYPNYEIITDIGSSLNFKRPGLIKIIKIILNKQLNELIIAYKDRLCRFGFELIEMLVNEVSHGKIIILESNSDTHEDELTKDLVSIINVFSAKLNGMRRYKNKN
jgi:predicted site-specific integrase-resolvase